MRWKLEILGYFLVAMGFIALAVIQWRMLG